MNTPFFRIAPEGLPIICAVAVLGWVFAIFGFVFLSFLFLVAFGFTLFFFRDPSRTTPSENGLVISPSDGRVIEVSSEREDGFLHSDVTRVSVFLSIFDCHVNWFPVSGEVTASVYRKGRFSFGFDKNASKHNEQLATLVKPDGGAPEIVVAQVAGFIARRIISHAPQGARLKRGDRFGIIKFGSRIDLFLPPEYEVRVKKGDRVVGSETVIARFTAGAGAG
ncbi:MAG: phosphatidylserine decarboxylase family protein [Candidatus Mycalebacterium zealandia]|nr:MAG: phosphatidylserine decarboxylase family protein [Candidatus Mycalebacterium zealandia]